MAKEKILVVDDEEDILELVRYNLSREGYHVTGTLTGEDALRKVRSDKFDLIVLDLMLPGMDGLEVCRIIKAEPELSDIKVIITTGFPEHPKLKEIAALGFNTIHYKPFNIPSFLEAVNNILDKN